jgi:hypothetical protein
MLFSFTKNVFINKLLSEKRIKIIEILLKKLSLQNRMLI